MELKTNNNVRQAATFLNAKLHLDIDPRYAENHISEAHNNTFFCGKTERSLQAHHHHQILVRLCTLHKEENVGH